MINGFQKKAAEEVKDLFREMRNVVFDAFPPYTRPEAKQQNVLAAILTIAAVMRYNRKM